jgi:hypothetical protein
MGTGGGAGGRVAGLVDAESPVIPADLESFDFGCGRCFAITEGTGAKVIRTVRWWSSLSFARFFGCFQGLIDVSSQQPMAFG